MQKFYKLDFDKVKTVEDIKTILKGLKLGYTAHCDDFDEIKHLLVEVDCTSGNISLTTKGDEGSLVP